VAVKNGAGLVSGSRVEKVVIERGKAAGVVARQGMKHRFYPADLVVLAAGGLGTPAILQKSGIACEERLFVDPVLCVAARIEGSRQNGEIPMPFIVQQEHCIISPYFDFLSFFYNRDWHYPSHNIYSLMIKLSDENTGSVDRRRVKKSLTETDLNRLRNATETCRKILKRLGARDDGIFVGTLNAGHPGGMLPLTEKEAAGFHHECLPGNVYVADASLFPRSLGNPPILTIIAMAKRIGTKCLELA
jgi:choline dehydrogenase-like flavoprotein